MCTSTEIETGIFGMGRLTYFRKCSRWGDFTANLMVNNTNLCGYLVNLWKMKVVDDWYLGSAEECFQFLHFKKSFTHSGAHLFSLLWCGLVMMWVMICVQLGLFSSRLNPPQYSALSVPMLCCFPPDRTHEFVIRLVYSVVTLSQLDLMSISSGSLLNLF